MSGDMSMEQNQLTRDLYAAGYTRENHPDFVYWSDWQNFGYRFEALLRTQGLSTQHQRLPCPSLPLPHHR